MKNINIMASRMHHCCSLGQKMGFQTQEQRSREILIDQGFLHRLHAQPPAVGSITSEEEEDVARADTLTTASFCRCVVIAHLHVLQTGRVCVVSRAAFTVPEGDAA